MCEQITGRKVYPRKNRTMSWRVKEQDGTIVEKTQCSKRSDTPFQNGEWFFCLLGRDMNTCKIHACLMKVGDLIEIYIGDDNPE